MTMIPIRCNLCEDNEPRMESARFMEHYAQKHMGNFHLFKCQHCDRNYATPLYAGFHFAHKCPSILKSSHPVVNLCDPKVQSKVLQLQTALNDSIQATLAHNLQLKIAESEASTSGQNEKPPVEMNSQETMTDPPECADFGVQWRGVRANSGTMTSPTKKARTVESSVQVRVRHVTAGTSTRSQDFVSRTVDCGVQVEELPASVSEKTKPDELEDGEVVDTECEEESTEQPETEPETEKAKRELKLPRKLRDLLRDSSKTMSRELHVYMEQQEREKRRRSSCSKSRSPDVVPEPARKSTKHDARVSKRKRMEEGEVVDSEWEEVPPKRSDQKRDHKLNRRDSRERQQRKEASAKKLRALLRDSNKSLNRVLQDYFERREEQSRRKSNTESFPAPEVEKEEKLRPEYKLAVHENIVVPQRNVAAMIAQKPDEPQKEFENQETAEPELKPQLEPNEELELNQNSTSNTIEVSTESDTEKQDNISITIDLRKTPPSEWIDEVELEEVDDCDGEEAETLEQVSTTIRAESNEHDLKHDVVTSRNVTIGDNHMIITAKQQHGQTKRHFWQQSTDPTDQNVEDDVLATEPVSDYESDYYSSSVTSQTGAIPISDDPTSSDDQFQEIPNRIRPPIVDLAHEPRKRRTLLDTPPVPQNVVPNVVPKKNRRHRPVVLCKAVGPKKLKLDRDGYFHDCENEGERRTYPNERRKVASYAAGLFGHKI